MDTKEPKVLIGCITDSSHAFCFDKFWDSLQQQDFKNNKVIFADISEDKNSDYSERLKKTGAEVISDTAPGHRIEKIVRCRKKIKEFAINNGFDYVLFTETDMILPKNTISRLLFHQKDLIAGVYLSNQKLGDKYELAPCLYDFAGEDSLRVMELREIIDNRLIEVFCGGFGCALISRKVLEAVDMRFFENSMAGDNIAFFVDARSKGFEAFADTSIKCNRMVKPEGDSLNNLFSFDAHPKINNPRVLIGCVTHDKDAVYVNGFLNAIRSQDYRNFDILFAENSGNKEFIATLRGTGTIVIECDPKLDHNIKRITEGRELIKEYAVKNNYDYLWFVDTDVVPPPTALSKLLADRKDLVAGICLSPRNVGSATKIMPNTYDFDDEEGYCRPLFLKDVLNNNLKEVSCAGFGCALISKAVLEKVNLRYYEKSMAGEDIAFFVDAREKGFRTFADNSVKCAHLILPPGDPRNRKFMFETYEKGTSFTTQIDNISKE